MPNDFVKTELATRFTYHAPKGDQAERYQMIRNMGKAFATLISEKTPFSREQTLAIGKIEEAVMWANAAIARREE